jgi:NitT/TauT family transport system ATP-binding protein
MLADERAPENPTGDGLLHFEDVHKAFSSPDGTTVIALEGFTLSVAAGEFLTVVGPSGCGKSTLLNLVVGLDHPTRGAVTLKGRPSDESRSRIGYVTQEDNLFPWRTLQRNVELPLEIRSVPKEERTRISSALIKKVGLGGFENRYAHQLSGGMRQRGNIVRALSFDPEIILMDEPFGPLDAQTRIVLQQQLLDIWSQQRRTVLFITHDLQEAIALADRVVVMTARPGRIKSVHEVRLPRPRNLYHLHENPEFRKLLSVLWDQLAEEVEAAQKETLNEA